MLPDFIQQEDEGKFSATSKKSSKMLILLHVLTPFKLVISGQHTIGSFTVCKGRIPDM
jgi:hypothetical protein